MNSNDEQMFSMIVLPMIKEIVESRLPTEEQRAVAKKALKEAVNQSEADYSPDSVIPPYHNVPSPFEETHDPALHDDWDEDK